MLKLLLLVSLISSCFASEICDSIDCSSCKRIVWAGNYVYDIIPTPGFHIVSLIYTIKTTNNSPFTYYTSLISDPDHYIVDLSNKYETLACIRTSRMLVGSTVQNDKLGLILTIHCGNILFSCEANIDITVEQLPDIIPKITDGVDYLMVCIVLGITTAFVGAFSLCIFKVVQACKRKGKFCFKKKIETVQVEELEHLELQQ